MKKPVIAIVIITIVVLGGYLAYSLIARNTYNPDAAGIKVNVVEDARQQIRDAVEVKNTQLDQFK